MVETVWSSTRRSAGVTCAAALAILGSGSAFFVWGNLFLDVLNAPPNSQGKHLFELNPLALFVMVSVPLFLIASGIRTGIGLFQLKPWARRAALVWAGVALLFCLWMIAFRPFETFFIPEQFVSDMESFKQLLAISLVVALFPISVWWIFFFRLPSVKRQFEEPAPRESTPN
ncbi:MAG TPA: hypothetical protein VNY24_19295 [Candidatus Acidoferrales bacterium]|jgi:hypothetical protein|nr:hypothetical protein [Candidatus Acidoferrales bacterium]